MRQKELKVNRMCISGKQERMKEKQMGLRWVAKQLADMQKGLKATSDETANSR